MKIVALKYGESFFNECYIYKGGKKDILLPISFTIYLIQSGCKNILIDVGCDDGAGFIMTVFKKPVDVLYEYGLKPDEITDIVITHSHHDHIEAIGYYSNATIHIQKDEFASAKKYIPQNLKINLFEEEFLIAKDIIIKKIGGHSIGSCIVLAKNYVLCGDECYHKKCLIDKIPTGSFYNEEKSKDFIDEYSKEKYIPLLFHDDNILKGKVGYLTI